jgi:hypothetical protein
MRKQLTELKQLLRVKEASYKELQADFSKLKEQNMHLLRKLETSKKFVNESEANYHKLLDEINAQHQEKIKEIIQRNSENEAKLHAEIETLKAKLQEKEILLAEKGGKIDEVLKEFSLRYKQLLQLRDLGGESEHLEELRNLKEREEKLKSLLKEAESRVQKAIEKEAAIERREQLLLREQEALNKQLDILKAAGLEIGKTKEYLKKKLSEVEAPTPTTTKTEKPPKIETMASVLEEVPAEEAVEIPKPELAEVVEAEEVSVAKEKRPLFDPKKKEEDKGEEFFNPASYSELDEIKSMIDVALQQGDSIQQIKKSLIDSGYSKANVEKALQQIKTLKG